MSTRDVSSKQENFVALMLGGITTPNSGAGHTKKGDIYENNSRSIRKTRSFNKRRL